MLATHTAYHSSIAELQANRIFESTSQETRASLGGTRVLFDDSEDNVTQKAFVR